MPEPLGDYGIAFYAVYFAVIALVCGLAWVVARDCLPRGLKVIALIVGVPCILAVAGIGLWLLGLLKFVLVVAGAAICYVPVMLLTEWLEEAHPNLAVSVAVLGVVAILAAGGWILFGEWWAWTLGIIGCVLAVYFLVVSIWAGVHNRRLEQ